ncbi:hypothetical protein [Enterococcus sp. LJL51]|uniref:hypothetical protein n=1 Tax=Enterococcus sp. LJL51 TaxID=3416656 RepID=UPI003CF78874
MSELKKEDLQALENDLKALKELYEKELQRESSERTTQATEDSKQSEISNTEKVTEKEQEQSFRASVLEALSKIESADSSASDESLNKLNENLETLIAYQEEQAQTNVNQDWLLSSLLVIGLVAVSGYALYKLGSYIASKVISIILY